MSDLFESLLRNDLPSYVGSLVRLAGAFERLPSSTTSIVATALTTAFARTLDQFPSIEAKRALLSALANAVLIAADESKLNRYSPVQKFIATNKRALLEVAGEPTTPLRLAGFWVKEPASRRLVRVRACESTDEARCVSIGHAIEALIDPYRLGIGACSLQEMMGTSLPDTIGYVCSRGMCGGSAAVDYLSSRGITQYGAPLPELQSLLCDLDDDGSGSGGFGGALDSELMTCAVSLVETDIGTETFRCAAGALEHEFPYVTEETPLSLEGQQCQVMDAYDDLPINQQQKLDEAKDRAKDVLGNAFMFGFQEAASEKLGVNLDIDNLADGWRAIDNAQVAVDSVCQGRPACTVNGNKIYIQLDAINDDNSSPEVLGQLLGHEGGHATLASGGSDATGAEEDEVMEENDLCCGGADSGDTMCAPEMDGCANYCGATNQRVREMLDCMDPSEGPAPWKLPDYGVVDPSPLDPADPEWASPKRSAAPALCARLRPPMSRYTPIPLRPAGGNGIGCGYCIGGAPRSGRRVYSSPA